MTRTLFSRLRRDRRGLAALELALLAPVLLVMATALLDTSRYVATVMKVQRTAANVADITAQFDELTDSMTVVNGDEVGVLFLAADEIGLPLDIAGSATVIVSSVANMGAGSLIMWQRQVGPGHSAIGAQGGVAHLPAGFTQASGDNAILVEILYPFTPYLFSWPWLGNGAGQVLVAGLSVYQPRLGTLTTLKS